jgi:hypothetical protein
MNQIEFYIKKSRHKVVPPFYSHLLKEEQSFLYRPVTQALEQQIKELNLNAGVHVVDLQDIPTKTNAFLLCILDENSMVTDDYVARITSMNNLHRDMAMLCGPVRAISKTQPLDWFISRIANIYKDYNIDGFSSFVSCYLNKDTQNYPPIEGCIFSGRHYNECGGYRAIITPRYALEKNFEFLSAIDKSGPIVYSEKLRTLYYVNSEEFDIPNFSKFYYCLGYYDGLQSTSGKFYNQFIVNANLLEVESLTWIRKNMEVPETKRDQYSQMAATLKLMYELGYGEAIVKNKLA